MMRKLLQLALFITAATLAGCGGSDNAFQGSGSSSGTGGTGGTSTGTDPVATVTVTTSSPTILADGSTSATITALVLDATNNLLANVPVTFAASSGGIAGSPATSSTSGAATVVLSTAGNPTLRTITVTATASGISKTVTVQVVPGTSGTSVQMGSVSGGTFTAGTLGIGTASLSAGGSTSVNATLEETGGALYTTSTVVTFSSPCQAAGLATITSPITTTSGIASTTYAATGCNGPDLITATATAAGSTNLSATGTVTVAAASVGSIVFVSATPTNIALKGTGASGSQETSTVIFKVVDSSGGPVAHATVDFTADTAVGGIVLAPTSGMTGSDGTVQTVVQSGTVATSVRVTAVVQGVTPTISTQSNELTITTGIPTQNAFSIAVGPCPNIEAWDIDGQNVTVTVRMADRFSNPVPDGTAVNLTTQGGKIGAQCVTGTTTTESGVCTVNWTSQDPRPPGYCGNSCIVTSTSPTAPAHPAGRSSILATAIGEESFVDANGNGEYDAGETFYDRAERFRDDADMTNDNFDTDSNYEVSTPIADFFYDFNDNGTRDNADGIFEGVLCTAGLPVCDPTKTSTGIGKRALIIFSTSAAVIAGPTSVSVAASSNGQLVYQIEDYHGNPIPWDATVTASASSSAGTITPSSFTEGCSINRGGGQYAFIFTAGSTAGAGTITITVTTKSGVVTTFTTSVTVT